MGPAVGAAAASGFWASAVGVALATTLKTILVNVVLGGHTLEQDGVQYHAVDFDPRH